MPCHLAMRDDYSSLTEEISQVSTSTSSRFFPQKYVCERDPVFSGLSEMDPGRPDSKKGWISLQSLKCKLIFQITR